MEENKELKYPIKYAVMPIVRQTGWNLSEREYGIVANIVSKCYVIGKNKSYLSDGTYKIVYEVVFPYTMDEDGYYQVSIPKYNIDSQCTNSTYTNQLFDSFEDALIVAHQSNNKILHGKIGYLPCNEDLRDTIEKIKVQHQKTLDKYKEFENRIQNETVNMEVTKSYNLNLEDIIEKIVKNPREFYIKLAHILSFEERECIKQLIENKSCDNCTNGSCNIENYEKVGLDEFNKPNGSSCLGWNNPELIGKKKILIKTGDK